MATARTSNHTSIKLLTFSDAVLRGIEMADQRPEHRRNQELAAKQLIDFMHGQFSIKKYQDVQQVHISAFVRYLHKDRRLAPNTVRAYVNPLRLAGNYAEDYFNAPPVSIKRLPERRELPKLWLNIDQLEILYRRAQKRGFRQTMLMVRVCGLAGLRLTELMRLIPDDLEKTKSGYTLRVASRERKTESSARVIPICNQAAEELLSYWRDKVKGFSRRTAWSRQCGFVIRDMREDGIDDVFEKFAPKDLRKSVPNLLSGIAEIKFVSAYLGHSAPQFSVTQRHYEAKTPRPNDPASVRDKAIADLREHVVKKIEKLLK